MSLRSCAGYLMRIHNPDSIRETINATSRALKDNFPEAEALAFRGMSGAAIGYPLAYKNRMPVLNVRKTGGDHHSMNRVEGIPNDKIAVKTYVIVDDLIETGSTVRAIIAEISDAKCIGIVLYNQIFARSSIDGIPVVAVNGDKS